MEKRKNKTRTKRNTKKNKERRNNTTNTSNNIHNIHGDKRNKAIMRTDEEIIELWLKLRYKELEPEERARLCEILDE